MSTVTCGGLRGNSFPTKIGVRVDNIFISPGPALRLFLPLTDFTSSAIQIRIKFFKLIG